MILLGLVVSGLCLVLVFRRVDLSEVGRHALGASWPILALVLVSRTGALLSAAARSVVILRRLHPFSVWRVVKSLLVSFVGNAVLPLRMGEVLRVAYLSRHSGGAASPTSCVAVLVVERVLDGVLLLVILALVVINGIVDVPVEGSFYLMAGVLVAALGPLLWLAYRPGMAARFAVRWPFVGKKLERFAQGLEALSGPRSLLLVILGTVGYWGFQALSIRIWFWAFGLTLPWYAPLVVLVFIAFGAALPSSPGFIGTYHFFAASALTLLGVTDAVAVSVATVGHFLALVPLTVVGALILAMDSAGAPDSSGRPHPEAVAL